MTISTGETAVKANSSEAERLFQRGLAAARGGQKRVAAGLLTRSVQLDPHNERAWLWLSGVLDNPQQQAFCLQAVLKINPQNEHARRGLQVLEERNHSAAVPVAAPGLTMPESAAAVPSTRQTDESWWVRWRRSRHETSRLRVLIWIFPLVLVGLAIALFESIALAYDERSQPLPTASVAAAPLVPSAPPLGPSVEPILEAEPQAVVESLTVGYLAALEPLRANLRASTASYREATSQPGGASVGYTAATQRLRSTVDEALKALAAMRPPGTLSQAHADYQKGLELELQGLDAILEFYSSYDVANANRAALRFQEARAYIDRAAAAYASRSQQLADLSAVSAHTPR